MEKSGIREKMSFKLVLVPIKARKPYYIIWLYIEGSRIAQLERLRDPDLATKWLLYNQSLINEGYVKVTKTGKGTVRVAFSKNVERHFKIYLFYVYSVLNTRSKRRADCLARCWSSIDAVTPVVDVLWELSRIVERRRFSKLLRGYCLC